MPRAKPFPDSDDEEKTTIESQWEEEASTTVEQGDVADKIRALGVEPRQNGTNVTSTSAGVDEPTVDEAHMSAITPVRDMARLQITQGNDAGQEIEIRPGKTYTIGRAIDNDIVLTDIAVSRKHFDLRFEDAAWVIVDRGSGNGTVVNGNLEDNPFMLANGDLIEIGNTVFRFDQPNAAPRPQRTMELDDEELSTVAGKPLRPDIVDMPEPMVAAAPRPARAKTLPPPAPLRANNASQPPPLGFPPLGPQPAATLPLPQMASRAPLATPAAPSQPAMLGADLAMQPVHSAPLQGPGASQQRPAYGYPQATEIPPHSVHAQMLLIQTQNRRGDGSTMHVPPTPYDALPVPPRYVQPQLSRRTKLVLAGVGLAVFAAVMTIAIVKSGKATATPTAGTTEPARSTRNPANGTTATPSRAHVETAATSEPTHATVPAKETTTEPAKQAVAKTEPAKQAVAKSEPVVEVKAEALPDKAEPAKQAVVKTEPKREPKRPEPRREPKRVEPKRVERREARRDPPVAPKRVAAAIDPDAAKNQADSLYRAKKFSEASAYLSSAAKKADEADARELRRTADMYAKLGRALAAGTAPATRATDAFEALRRAQNYDRNVGNAFDEEIQTKLGQVAPKAALSYVAARDYPAARTALTVAQRFGASESVKIVAIKLESAASELYNDAVRELKSDPAAAKEKFRQIKSIVDAKSTWYQRAQKQLQGS